MNLHSLLCIYLCPYSDPEKWSSTSTKTPTKKVKTLPPMSSGTYPPSPKSTNTPTILLPARPPVSGYWTYPPTTYQQITTRNDFNIYLYIWLKNNMEDKHATDAEKDLYHELVAKYG